MNFYELLEEIENANSSKAIVETLGYTDDCLMQRVHWKGKQYDFLNTVSRSEIEYWKRVVSQLNQPPSRDDADWWKH